MKTEEIVRVLTFAAGNSDDCVFRECVTTAISRLQAAEEPCEKCEEWERAFDAFLFWCDHRQGFHKSWIEGVKRRFDPRRKPEPAKEFTSKDWLWG